MVKVLFTTILVFFISFFTENISNFFHSTIQIDRLWADSKQGHSFRWKDEPDNWIPANKGLPANREFVDLTLYKNSYVSAIRGKSGGLYRWNEDSDSWEKLGDAPTKYGMNRLHVVGSGEGERLITYRERDIWEWNGSSWVKGQPSPVKLSGLATNKSINDLFYATSHDKKSLRIYEYRFSSRGGDWILKKSQGLVYAPGQHSDLLLSHDGSLFLSYKWRGRSRGNIGTKSAPIYEDVVYRSIDGGNRFIDVTKNGKELGIHLGNMTNGINPGPFGSLHSVKSGSKTEMFAITEQGIFVRTFSVDKIDSGKWEQVFRYWGNRGFAPTETGDDLIIFGSGGVEVWDNRESSGNLKRRSRMLIGQRSAYSCRWNRIRNIQSQDGKEFFAWLTVSDQSCDRKKTKQMGFVRLKVDPNKTKSSYNLDLDLAGYISGKGQKEAIGLLSLDRGQFALIYNENGKGRIQLRNNDGRSITKTIEYEEEIRDGKSPSGSKVFAITGAMGTQVLDGEGNIIRTFSEKGYRVSINEKGRLAVLVRGEGGNHSIQTYSPAGNKESETSVKRSYVEDVAISPKEDLVVVAGFDNKRRKGVPVQVAFVTGLKGSDLTKNVFSTWGHAGEEMGNDMADTRIYKLVFGDNDKLYVLGETAGGNTVFRWNGKDFQTPTMVKYDIYNDPFQTKSEHKLYYGIVDTQSGKIIQGQMTFPRTSDYRGNTLRAKDGSIYVDDRGIVFIGGGGTASAIEGRGLRTFNNGSVKVGDYSGGDTSLLVVSPDFRTRILWTVFAASGKKGTGKNVPGAGEVTGITVNKGKVGILASAHSEGRLVSFGTGEGIVEEPPGFGEGKKPRNLYFSVFPVPP